MYNSILHQITSVGFVMPVRALVVIVALISSIYGHHAAATGDVASGVSCNLQPKGALFSGSVEIDDSGLYGVYVKLPRQGQAAGVSIHAEASVYGSFCRKVGEARASGDVWTKVGTLRLPDSGEVISLDLSSDEMSSVVNANRPSVLLIDEDDPVCSPEDECYVGVDDNYGYVYMAGASGNEDSLRVFAPQSPEADEIESVGYYVDDRLVYSTSTLQDFDLRYAVYPGQKIDRLVAYSSGQRLVFNDSVPEDHVDSFANFLFRLTNSSPVIVRALLALGVVALLVGSVLLVLGVVARQRNLRIHHGFESVHDREAMTEERRAREYARYRSVKYIKSAALGLVVVVVMGALVYSANQSVVKLSRVDGVSMMGSFSDGEIVAVNNVPVTWARVKGGVYSPDRGDVVISRASFGDEFSEDDFMVIKRVLGLPGERVVIKDGKIVVYNDENPKGFDVDAGSDWSVSMVSDNSSDTIDLLLRHDEVFIIGDNRPESIDSRFNGPINARQLIGRVEGKVWPLW